MKTRRDVVELAFRRLGIKAEGEALSADQAQYAGDVLESLHAELSVHCPVTWWPDQIGDAEAVALANLLATEIGPSYDVPTEPRARAFARLLAVMRPDNRVEQDRPDGSAAYF